MSEKDLGVFDRSAMLMKLPPDAKVISREKVEQVAAILGEESIAMQALARARAHGGPVRFWYSNSESMLWVELTEDERH
jgi:hypothetical protein